MRAMLTNDKTPQSGPSFVFRVKTPDAGEVPAISDYE
jgi:hypothetical protein